MDAPIIPIKRKLKALPDYLEVLPGAYAGSVCGRSLSAMRNRIVLENDSP